MADTTTATNREATGEPPPAARSPILSRIKIFLFVTLVIAVECCLAYLYLPSASQASPKPEAPPAAKAHAAAPAESHAAPEEKAESSEQMEVDLGQFTITAFQPVSNTTLRIDFHLYGTVARADEKEFRTRWEENLHRFREQVILTVRSAEMTDLTDAGLGLIKRTIQDKANRTLGKPLLRAMVFSDFSFIEQ